jgi:adenine/guanine phosphoribosyltransferase-like PRPP-binding protein
MYREAKAHGCSWVAAPAPRALPLLGAVAMRGGFPACYIHKSGDLPGTVRSVKEGPYELELPADLSLKGHKVALIDDGVASGASPSNVSLLLAPSHCLMMWI